MKKIIYYKKGTKFGAIHCNELIQQGILTGRNVSSLPLVRDYTSTQGLRNRKLRAFLYSEGITEFQISEANDE